MTRIALLLLAVFALGLAACGGGDDDDGDAAPGTAAGTGSSEGALSKDEFIEQGDEICRDLQQKAQALGREAQELAGVPLDDPKTTKAAAAIWRKQVDLVQELKTRFDALGPPPEGEETTVGDFREDITRALALGKQIAGALEQGDDPTVLVGDYTQLIDQSNATAGLIGFKVCGQT
jgi:alkanesulfonate monooxygenase SsuD/methylene tetrahydromethanopterin reductase-like flavin-dependent oxidoreductase (luciferase family)